jgi:ectoine hydroxylase
MNLSAAMLNSFNEFGYLSQEGLFEPNSIQFLNEALEKILNEVHPGHVLEEHGKSYRALHGCHLYDQTFKELVHHPKLVNSAKQMLGEDVYLHQLKINIKAAFSGEIWPWHQDYIFWRNEDSMPSADVLSVMIFLDDVTEFNGPLFFIPKSHHLGCIEVTASKESPEGWLGNVSANLKYQIDDQLIKEQTDQHGMYSAKGKKGTAVWFHGNLIHGSPPNISPYARKIAILTYNPIRNTPDPSIPKKRPEFLNARNTLAISCAESAHLK